MKKIILVSLLLSFSLPAYSFPIAETLGAVNTFWTALAAHLALFFETLKRPQRKENNLHRYLIFSLAAIAILLVFMGWQQHKSSTIEGVLYKTNNQKVELKALYPIQGLGQDFDPVYTEENGLDIESLQDRGLIPFTITQKETSIDKDILGLRFSRNLEISPDFSPEKICEIAKETIPLSVVLVDYNGILAESFSAYAAKYCDLTLFYLEGGIKAVEDAPLSTDYKITAKDFLLERGSEGVIVLDVNNRDEAEIRGYWENALSITPYDLINPSEELIEVLKKYKKVLLTQYSPGVNYFSAKATEILRANGVTAFYLPNSGLALSKGVNYVSYYPSRDRVVSSEHIYNLLKTREDVVFLDMRAEHKADFPDKINISTRGMGYSDIYRQVSELPPENRYITLVHNQRTAFYSMMVGKALHQQNKLHLGSNNTPFLFNEDIYRDNFIHESFPDISEYPELAWWHFLLLGLLARILIEAFIRFRLPSIHPEQTAGLQLTKVLIAFILVTWHYIYISETLITAGALDHQMILGRFLTENDNWEAIPIVAFILYFSLRMVSKSLENRFIVVILWIFAVAVGWLISSFELLTVIYTIGLLFAGLMFQIVSKRNNKVNELNKPGYVFKSPKSQLLSRFSKRGIRTPQTLVFSRYRDLKTYIESKECKAPVIIRSAHESEDVSGLFGSHESYELLDTEDWLGYREEIKNTYKELGAKAQFMVQKHYKGLYVSAHSYHPSVPGEMLVETSFRKITGAESNTGISSYRFSWLTKKWGKQNGKRLLGFIKRALIRKLVQEIIKEIKCEVSIEAIFTNGKLYLLQVKTLSHSPKSHDEETAHLIKMEEKGLLFPNTIASEYGDMPLLAGTIVKYVHGSKAIYAWGRVVLKGNHDANETDTTAFTAQTQRFLYDDFKEIEGYTLIQLKALLKTELDTVKAVVSGEGTTVPLDWVEGFESETLSPISDYDVSKPRFYETRLPPPPVNKDSDKDRLHLVLAMHFHYMRRLILQIASKLEMGESIFHYSVEQLFEDDFNSQTPYRIAPKELKRMQGKPLENVMKVKGIKAKEFSPKKLEINAEGHRKTNVTHIANNRYINKDDVVGKDVYLESGYQRILPYLDDIASITLKEGVMSSHVVMSAIEKKIPLYIKENPS